MESRPLSWPTATHAAVILVCLVFYLADYQMVWNPAVSDQIERALAIPATVVALSIFILPLVVAVAILWSSRTRPFKCAALLIEAWLFLVHVAALLLVSQ